MWIVRQQQQQQQQQHFISPHNIREIKIYNNSTDDDRGGTQEQRKQKNAHKELSKLPVY